MLIDGILRKSIESHCNYEVKIINQTLLPHRLEFISLESFNDCCKAIKDMWVRGAPLIGVTAAFGMFFAIKENPSDDNIEYSFNKLLATRPTAVDLKWALENIIIMIEGVTKKEKADLVWQFSRNLEIDS